MIAVTHDGIFHADDVLAAAILKICYPKVHFIRTRQQPFPDCDVLFDVGLEYDGVGKFDHHQKDKPLREDGTPYSSAGLLWEHKGMFTLLCCGINENHQQRSIWNAIDREIMYFIDANDNGVETSTKSVLWAGKEFARLVSVLNPQNGESEYDAFIGAVGFVENILRRTIAAEKKVCELVDYLQSVYHYTPENQKQLLILEEPHFWTNLVSEHCPETLYFISPDANGNQWGVTAVRKIPNEFAVRQQFPPLPTGGLELEEEIGIKDVIFAHSGRFFIATKTKEAAIAVAEWALGRG